MILNERKKEYIDKESFRILDLFEETDEVKEETDFGNGSLSHIIPIDLTDKTKDIPHIIKEKRFNETVAFRESYKGKCIGLNEKNYKTLMSLVLSIYNEKGINSIISLKFIVHKTIEWLLDTYKNKKAERNFSSYIIDEMENSIEEYEVHYLILHLDIWKPFKIGKTKFGYFTKELFDELSRQYKLIHPDEDNSPFEQMRTDYQGRVYVSLTVKAEKEKAKEIALEECSIAVDILKMCFDTTDIPQLKLSFDIDCRTKENAENMIVISKPNVSIDNFSICIYRLPSHHKIFEDEWERISRRQMNVFHNFLNEITYDKTELEQLIINGIKRYGNAISNNNLHQRILEIYTILESLVLIDNNAPIIESVCKYCPNLVLKKLDDRKQLIKLLKKMYNVRSSLIHHAKEIKFEIDDLRKLQYTVITLLSSLIKKAKIHKNKQSLIQEIDDTLLNAY